MGYVVPGGPTFHWYRVNFVLVPYRLRAGSGSTSVVCLVVCAVLWNSLLVNNLLPHSRASGVSIERESDTWIISLGYGQALY